MAARSTETAEVRPIDIKLDRMLRIADVLEVVGIGRSTLYKMVADGRFPRPVRVGLRASRWRQSDIQQWMDSLPLATEENWR